MRTVVHGAHLVNKHSAFRAGGVSDTLLHNVTTMKQSHRQQLEKGPCLVAALTMLMKGNEQSKGWDNESPLGNTFGPLLSQSNPLLRKGTRSGT